MLNLIIIVEWLVLGLVRLAEIKSAIDHHRLIKRSEATFSKMHSSVSEAKNRSLIEMVSSEPFRISLGKSGKIGGSSNSVWTQFVEVGDCQDSVESFDSGECVWCACIRSSVLNLFGVFECFAMVADERSLALRP